LQLSQLSQLIGRRRKRRAEQTSRSRRPLRQLGLILAVGFLLAVALAAGGLAVAYSSLSADLPSVAGLPVLLNAQNGKLLQPTRLYDRTSEHLVASLENPGLERRFLPLNPAMTEHLSPLLASTIVALVEPDYWQAPVIGLSSMTAERPDTIAERLVSSLLLPGEENDLRGRLRVRLLAGEVLTRYGRSQVLEWYINSVSFGHLTFGADSAARLYLGKGAGELDAFDTALLIAALESPALNPMDAPAAAREKQLSVLNRMALAGVITPEEFEQALVRPAIDELKEPEEGHFARAFTQLVLDRISEDIDRQLLERGGLRIITTLDYDLQTQLACTLRTQLARLDGSNQAVAADCPAASLLPSLPLTTGGVPPGVEAAASAVLMDPITGQVLALAGDTSPAGGEAAKMVAHPSGTMQTPWLALAGFARSLSPATLVWDIPPEDLGEVEAAAGFHGPVRLRTALVNDYLAGLNTVLQQVGAPALTSTAHSLGLEGYTLPSDLDEVFQIGPELTPLHIIFAINAFNTLGQQSGVSSTVSNNLEPQLVLSVENAPTEWPISAANNETRPIVSPDLAFLVHNVLADEAARWPSSGHPNPLEIGRPAGAKAGTAADGSSTWAAGYTRQLAGAVWLGFDLDLPGTPPLDVQAAAGIWHALMQYGSRGQPVLDWQMPAGVTVRDVCDPSGLLPTAQCPKIVTEVFLQGTTPLVTDNLYQLFQINRETGRLATAFTPPELVDQQVFLVVPLEAQAWSRAAAYPVPPQEYDTISLRQADANARIDSPAQYSNVRGKLSIRGSAGGEGFSSYSLQIGQGINPTSWLTAAGPMQSPVQRGLLGEIDTDGLNGLYVIRLMVVQQNQLVKTDLLQVTIDNTPPRVTIPYPLDGQVFSAASQRAITLQADATDETGLGRVEWWVDGRKLGERLQEPYAWVWDASAGNHTLQIRAVDLAGNETGTEEIIIKIQ